MTKILVLAIFMAGFSAEAKTASGGLVLRAVVPLKASVQIYDQTSAPRVENQSSKELKFEISSRSPSSIVTISAP